MTWGEKKKIKIQSVRSKTNVNLSNAKSKEREGERGGSRDDSTNETSISYA